MNITLRQAVRSDMNGVFDLVKELAEFENAPQEVTIDAAYYEQCFDENIFECIVAVDGDNEVVGVCLYYMTYSTWKGKMLYLEDFVVRESARGSGIGQKLFDAYIARAKELNCTMTKWQVLDWNEGAVRFYERNNAIIDKEWWNCKIIF